MSPMMGQGRRPGNPESSHEPTTTHHTELDAKSEEVLGNIKALL